MCVPNSLRYPQADSTVTIPASAIAKLAAIGLTAEQAAAVAEVMADVEVATAAVHEASKAKARDRVAKWREKQAGNVTKRNETSRNGLRGRDARVEDKTSNTDIEPPKKHTQTDLDAFKAALSGVCDAERVDAFVKHRRTKRGSMTAHAAKLFLADAEACGLSAPDAVDTCISRNWITVKPDWLTKPNSRAGPAKGRVAIRDSANKLAQEMVQSDAKLRSSESVGGVRQAIPNLSVVSGGNRG